MTRVNDEAAINELRGLSRNARAYLEDRIGNRLGGMVGFASLGIAAKVEEASAALITDLQKIGCFTFRRGGAVACLCGVCPSCVGKEA